MVLVLFSDNSLTGILSHNLEELMTVDILCHPVKMESIFALVNSDAKVQKIP